MVSSIKVFRYNGLIVFITTTKLQKRDMSLQLQYDSTDLNLQKIYVKEVILLNAYCKMFVATYFTHIKWKKICFKFRIKDPETISINSLEVSSFMTFGKLFANKDLKGKGHILIMFFLLVKNEFPEITLSPETRSSLKNKKTNQVP